MRKLFYDLETTHEHPQYCDITLVGVLVRDKGAEDDGFRYVWKGPLSESDIEEIKLLLCADDVDERVSFNDVNFDDLVFANHGIHIPEKNTYDAMLAVKTVYPGLPAHGLKFLCWYLLGDPHWPEFEMLQKGHRFGDEVTPELEAYHDHDLYQHEAIWEFVRERVFSDMHREAYMLEMGMKDPLEEMTFEGGVLVDTKKARETLNDLEGRKAVIQEEIQKITDGKVKNANSNKQVGAYLANVENFELNLTETGEFQVKKKDLADIVGMTDEEMRKWNVGATLPDSISPVALLAWQMKDNETVRKYVKNYYEAAVGTGQNDWIPSAYQVSRAGTRRTLSKSFYKINFQNSTESIDGFKLIPPGYLGWFIDSTQVENVVHIHESRDLLRRRAYEADEDWNEYVWLCNRILGATKTKKELDSIKSKQVPHWSIYKLYKTIKLALNFGMGVRKFSKTLGIDEKVGKGLFQDIHNACPAIRQLQDRIEAEMQSQGYVQDVFGHIYTGHLDEAYKVVAFLIQGCGTGSLPKAQLRANYDTLHAWSARLGVNVGPLSNTTHDEQGGLLRLDLGEEVITSILQELMGNMTDKFNHKFDGIPLRAKLYLTTTNWKDRKEHEQPNWRNAISIPR